MEQKDELIRIRKEKIEGILLRTKARYAAEGQKVTKYYCNLENRHHLSKQMFKLIAKDGTTIRDNKLMLDETKSFYQKLYEEKDIDFTNLNEYIKPVKTLTEEDKIKLEGKITKKEASIALKNMNNNKSPGTDGFTVEFFKFFWGEIGNFVVRSLNEGFEKKEMSITQREGIIICIPKGDKPREYLKNWRPISLLNVVYKIGSSAIANRIKTVLPNLINEDQTGFVPGRYIGDNIRLIYDIIHHLESENQPGLIVSIDFEKAFDSVNWKFMNTVLEKIGFGNDIMQWVNTFYNSIHSYVMVNGTPSEKVDIKRGCRQGDPISPYLFILCAEILACKIRGDENIKGIKIGNTESKITQFADDTSALLEGDRISFENLFRHLDNFAAKSGLKLNKDKTTNV